MDTWKDFFKQEESKLYFRQLMQFLDDAYTRKRVFPPREDLFTCFKACPLHKVKVVILGQDPYHKQNQAHGLCFSVQKGRKIPPSLKNIYKELKADVGVEIASHGFLMDWAKQGVFMMNAVMSVEEGKAGSHRNIGWEIFSDHVIQLLDKQPNSIVFILWGNWAQQKGKLIHNKKHKILCAPHPSPLSAYQGFFGSRPFSKANEFLVQMNRLPIDWKIGE